MRFTGGEGGRWGVERGRSGRSAGVEGRLVPGRVAAGARWLSSRSFHSFSFVPSS